MEETYRNTTSYQMKSLIDIMTGSPLKVASTFAIQDNRTLQSETVNHYKGSFNASQNSSIFRNIIGIEFDNALVESYLRSYLKSLGISEGFEGGIASILLDPFQMLSPVRITLLILLVFLALYIFYFDNAMVFSAAYYVYLCNFLLTICIVLANFNILERALNLPYKHLPRGLEHFIMQYPYCWMFCEIFVMLPCCLCFVDYVLRIEYGQIGQEFLKNRYVKLLVVLLVLATPYACYYIIRAVMTSTIGLIAVFYSMNIAMLLVVSIPLGIMLGFMLRFYAASFGSRVRAYLA